MCCTVTYDVIIGTYLNNYFYLEMLSNLKIIVIKKSQITNVLSARPLWPIFDPFIQKSKQQVWIKILFEKVPIKGKNFYLRGKLKQRNYSENVGKFVEFGTIQVSATLNKYRKFRRRSELCTGVEGFFHLLITIVIH